MDKLEFVSRQLAKAEKKKYEHYVVTRIWHLLNDTRIKFITQQFVTRPSGKALTDMYFPQLEIHIEVDEGHHKKQIEADKLREADIINATGHKIFRIDVTKDIDEVNKEINKIVHFMKDKIETSNNLKAWDLDAEQNPQTYIKLGYIDLNDDVAFRTSVDAANCFGANRKPKGIWGSSIKHPKEVGKLIWFPKLYLHKGWENEISNDETVITEKNIVEAENQEFIEQQIQMGSYHKIVFAQGKDSLGMMRYRFKGEFKLNLEKTREQNRTVWERIATRVNTYAN